MEKTGQNSDSPVGVLEDYFRSVESDTNSSTEENESLKKQTTSRFRGFLDFLRTKSKKQLPALASLSVPKLPGFRSASMREQAPNSSTGSRYIGNADSPCRNFTLHELQLATKNFSQENFIGKGGYAEVYTAQLHDGKVVAVKRLTKGTPEDRIADFLAELGIMAHVNHPNTTKLIGYCVEGGMHLVLEYSHLGSLASLLHGSNGKLGWNVRYKIALGIADGLMYLHNGCQRRIIHRDIKAANILLTRDFEPQICDFGLAKWLPDKWTHHIVLKFEGTFGYLAPEFMMHGIVDERTDVFAFGVLLLELITGRRALDCSQQSLVMWAKPLLRKNNIRELIDPALNYSFNSKQMKLMLLAAALCVQRSSILRPRMNEVVQLLKGNLSSMESLKKYKKPSFWKIYSEENTDA
ncbi:hypothetical protein BVRB_7g165890 isoform A [Beta vulgaris subsp. vulgaris]|uniref:receptor-like cytosolic serine/threonine-protein kinase RBK2 isoform X1 n=1 Tax=Beta vulgaris subsp. vulgaris TaxID=3555 RepID=UPI00053FD660|nr:receptor-like cytosolic serine/threonine-protein kinase RBK2 isoform X1 [Beta vulgaris subsp. vulgaris]XP_010684733.1 receptor-like cytosolic serine/threonine-protein kinase RBK2 isoform X1 [Beta vulgaris subsp. vulgaris]XP_048504624.1 receptor-like cytosolic serine/threonine-protein kinase RBK2 isoform X1 [Beta vulgaris subsp. vulgaris]XP_048504627.1 receptor-like cytosolic serine/threonine-protein kinase RBK2 isoform X1 [Beta vulgaris subsp. vulgaris]XP_048504628.1 receptor-like cytosolic 